MLKFHSISKVFLFQTAFFIKIFTSLNDLKFQIKVSDADSNKFCKFCDIWITLRKSVNFSLFIMSGRNGIFHKN